MNLIDLASIAKSVVDKPWGLGLSHLNNAESSAPYYRFLHAVVERYKPRIVVECGSYLGIATEHMALGNADTRVITIDFYTRREVLNASKRCRNITVIYGDTVKSKDKVYDICKLLEGKIGLLFLDSEHDGLTPRAEYETYFDLFDNECLVVCDDILDPRMKEFWNWLPGVKMEMNFLHPSQYPGFPEPGFGISIVGRQNA